MSVSREERDRAIVTGYIAGNSLDQLAWVFGLSSRRISGIVAVQHAARTTETQVRLNRFHRRPCGRPRLPIEDDQRRAYIALLKKVGSHEARKAFGVS